MCGIPKGNTWQLTIDLKSAGLCVVIPLPRAIVTGLILNICTYTLRGAALQGSPNSISRLKLGKD